MPININPGDSIDPYINANEHVEIPPGTYAWDGTPLDAGSSTLEGLGDYGDVVLELDDRETMRAYVRNGGTLRNVTVRGANGDAKAGLYPYPGATVDGFVWPEGARQDEDRALYTSDGGDDPITVEYSAWAGCANNGAYCDKPRMEFERCAALNNNIANIRVGHRDGTPEGSTTYIRNSLIAVTADIPHDVTNTPNSRGIRLRHPAHLVIENCWFVYFDVDGAADLIELHDGAAGASVEIRNCHFHNDTDRDLVRDKSNGDVDVLIEDCTVSGRGSRAIDPDFEGTGIFEDDSITVPTPAQVTQNPHADDAWGFEAVEPFADADTSPDYAGGDTDADTGLSPDDDGVKVVEVVANQTGGLDYSFLVNGRAELHETSPKVSAGSGDSVVENPDGTNQVIGFTGNPGYGDAYLIDGGIMNFSWTPEAYDFDVFVDGVAVNPDGYNADELPDDPADEEDDSEGVSDSPADGTDTPADDADGLTEADVEALIAEHAVSEPHLTTAQVTELIEDALADLALAADADTTVHVSVERDTDSDE